MDLLCAPSFNRVVSDLLTWKDIVSLDEACLNRERRERFLSWLAAPGVICNQLIDSLSGYAWLNTRGCKAANLRIEMPGNIGIQSEEEEIVQQWLLKYGQFVRTLRLYTGKRLQYYELHFLTFAAGAYCKNVERLALEHADLCRTSFVLPSILRTNAPVHQSGKIQGRCLSDQHCCCALSQYCESAHCWPLLYQTRLGCRACEDEDIPLLEFRMQSRTARTVTTSGAVLSIGKVHMSDFSTLLKACPELTYLAVSSCTINITEAVLAYPHFRNLETFIVGEGHNVGLIVLYLVCHAKSLRRLSYGAGLSGTVGVGSNKDKELYDTMCLERILYGPPAVSPAVTSQQQPALREDQSPLQELAVSTFSADTLLRVLSWCPRLHTLRMVTCPADLDSVPVSELLLAFGHVRVLELHKVYVSHMRCLSQLSGLQRVRLSFEGCDGPFAPLTAALMSLASNNSRTLQQLDLRQVFLTSAQLRSLLGQLPLLEEARVVPHWKANKIKPPTLLELRQVCPRLRTFTSGP